ncbi:response regulator transcription factor [Mesorhizobium sp. CAU 1741]|uniref:helix-turn-helix transcriptional regulator n=1 Tax=Mesorhizobium sp. CAU 1741 TaxID=3140366 RepID=UPI00325AAFA4
MPLTRAIIVSDSSLLSSALAGAISTHFKTVLKFNSLSAILIDEDWESTVVIIDAPYPAASIETLKSLATRADLSRTILLLRGNQTPNEFKGLVGLVGAILPNSFTLEEIGLVAQLVRGGLFLLPADMLPAIALNEAGPSRIGGSFEQLTEREQSVLLQICEGAGNKAIARKLNISDSTVRVHVRAILRKLGLQNRTQAALHAFKNSSGAGGKSAPPPQ